MHQGCHAANTPGPVGEPDGDVGEDCNQRQDNGDNGIALHLACDGSIHAVGRNDTVGVVQRGGELFLSHLVCKEALQRIVNLTFDLLVGLLAAVVNFIFGGDTHLGCTTKLLNLGCLAKLLHCCSTNGLGCGGLVKADNVSTTAAEVNTVAEALGEDAYQSYCAENTGNNVGNLAQLDEVDVSILEEVSGCGAVKADVFVARKPCLEYQTRDKDGGEHGGDDTDYQHGCKTLNGAAAEEVKDYTCNQGGQLTVDDCGVCILVTVADGQTQGLAAAQLLFDTLVDNHIGIHRHTHCQHQTGDTGKGEHGAKANQGTEQEQHVAKQGKVGCPTCTAVEYNHIDEHQQEGECKRNHTVLDGLATQGRTNHLFLHDACGGGELTALEHGGKVFCLFRGEVAGNLAATAANLVLYVGVRINQTVHNDGNLLADILLCDNLPARTTGGIHGHADLCRT